MKAIPNSYSIRDLFEIQIRKSDWLRIAFLSRRFNITYSAAVRLCTFQLIKQGLTYSEAQGYKEYIKLKYKGWLPEMPREPLHRHMLCLYGDDALQLRIIAAHNGLSISDFVRLALELFLPTLEDDLLQERIAVVKHGIKVYESAKMENLDSFDMDFHNQRIELRRFGPNAYWAWNGFSFSGFA